jgi:pyrimidine-nucleoside phosphorylase
MRAVDIIIKKRDKEELTREEIRYFVDGISSGSIPDYQISAWAMAVLLNGMTPRETTELTLAMAQSGEVLDMHDVVDNYLCVTDCSGLRASGWQNVWPRARLQWGDAG